MKEYKNDHIIIHWFPELCAHPGICLRLLPEVFDLNKRPWANVNGAEPEEIIKAIDQCPSGALRYSFPRDSKVDRGVMFGPGNINLERSNSSAVKIKVVSNGPFFIEGMTEIIGSNGEVLKKGSRIALCRCGYSGNQPFCDGSHNAQKCKP